MSGSEATGKTQPWKAAWEAQKTATAARTKDPMTAADNEVDRFSRGEEIVIGGQSRSEPSPPRQPRPKPPGRPRWYDTAGASSG